MPQILVLHGPNLNLLGQREPDHYGTVTLLQINTRLQELGRSDDIVVDCRQSNAEHELIDWIQSSIDTDVEFIIINPAAFTHTSVAIRDALLLLDIPIIEVHLSNIYKREKFRHKSMLAGIVTGQITGLGSLGYTLALNAIAEDINGK